MRIAVRLLKTINPIVKQSLATNKMVKEIKISTIFSNSINEVTADNKTCKLNISPLAMSLGSLAYCQNSTIRNYASQKKLKIGEIKYNNVSTNIDLTAFFGMKDPAPNKFQGINVDCVIESNATDEQFKSMIESIEHRCPIHCMFEAAGVKVTGKYIQKKI